MKHESLLAFNKYRTDRHTTKSNKQLLLDFKNQQGFKICIVLKSSLSLIMVKCSFRKHSTFTHVQSRPSEQGGVPHKRRKKGWKFPSLAESFGSNYVFGVAFLNNLTHWFKIWSFYWEHLGVMQWLSFYFFWNVIF